MPFYDIMALKSVLIAFTCALAFPAAALAQSPAWAMPGMATCCTATDDGGALAASVLLPAPMILADDARASALAAAVLLPPADHSAHAMADMACCQREAASPAKAEDGCSMPCCQPARPTR